MGKSPSGQRPFRGQPKVAGGAGVGVRRGADAGEGGSRGKVPGGFKVKSRGPVTGADRWKQRAEQHAAERQARKEQKEAQQEADRKKGFERTRPLRGKALAQQGPTVSEPMRIAKAMARAGLCSRREAERWIADGRVSINGRVLKTPAVEVQPRDRVLVDGKPLPVAEPAQLWRYNKPKGVVTTNNDPQGRPTVFDNLPPGLPRVVSIGRLDFNTEGLLLLTNDGELARHLELPSTGWLRRYRVRAKGRVTQADLDQLKEGVEIEGVRYGPVDATIDSVQGANMWITVGIREGKNREVRKVLSNLMLEVNRLIRISFGPFQLSDLEPGQAEIVRRRVLADQLGPKLAQDFGLIEAEKTPAKGAPRKGAARKPQAKGSEDLE
ncbi:MAG: pseudouridine synthase [Hyphomicrobium sp.]|jgi:23S rRNA pseudouridine2605 synthase